MISRLSRNVAYNVAGQIVLTLISLLAVHVIYRRLGASSFGVVAVSLVWSTTLVSALELGFSTVVVKAVVHERSQQSLKASGLLRSATTVYWGLAACGALAVYFGLPPVFHLLFRSVGHTAEGAVAAARIIIIGGLLAVPRVLYQAVLRGAERMGGFNLINVASQLAQQLGTFLLVTNGAGLLPIAWWILAWVAVPMAGTALAAKRVVPAGSLVPGWDRAAIRRYQALARSMATVSMTAVVQTQGDQAAVAWTLPVQTAGYYATAEGLLGRAQALVTAAAEASLPSLAQAHLKGGEAMVVRYRKLHDLICFGSLPLYACVVFAAGPLYQRLFSPGAARLLEGPSAFLALGFFASATLSALYMTALAADGAGTVARINVLSTAVVFPVVVVLTHYAGVLGASLAWLAYSAMLYLLMVPRLAASTLGITAPEWFKSTARSLPSLLAFAAGWVVAQLLGPQRLLVAGGLLAATLAAHVALTAFLVGPELKGTFSSVLAALSSKKSAAPS